MTDDTTLDRLTGETTELLQAMIRNQCVNDGTPESGHESRNADLLRTELEGTGADIETLKILPGRDSIVARLPGTDPDAPALMLMGHTDVVPVSPEGWKVDPFSGERIGDEIWGRGAVDMLNVTSSMAVAFRHIAKSGTRHPGDIVYFGVADEEAGGRFGAMPLVEDRWDALQCDYVLTEYGGSPLVNDDGITVLLTTAEKGGAAQVVTVSGEPGHGSMPYRTDNAVAKAAEIVRRIEDYNPGARIDELFTSRIKAQGFDAELEAKLLDPGRIEDALAEMEPALARNLHSCCHTSFSNNIINGGTKINTIPDSVELQVDIRILPGETEEDVRNHLQTAIGPELMGSVEIRPYFDQESMSTASSTDTPMWSALVDSIQMSYPGAKVLPSMVTGGTDARFFRRKGVPSYGAGLLSSNIGLGEFMSRFHGHNERIDIESLRLTTKLWLDVCDRLWA
ncbi:MAG: M20/M25/M40 family metallo-hydrolase [Acidimicrobiales bacterium]|nr:M20/M25/M40 family metallo-hydrolase [Acidimicrobiales bacterium]RZV42361.1 MAG: M20/M25/M40 family metallo-hydrolase [Acidimicrobiales bacterium]